MTRRANMGAAVAWGVALFALTSPAFTGCSSSSDDSAAQDQGDAASGNDSSRSDGSTGNDGSSGGCAADQTACGSECVSTSSDNANCGSCGHACAAGEVCSAGACGITCSAGLSLCSGVANVFDAGAVSADAGDAGVVGEGDAGIRAPYCANLQSENDNCGTCGNVCPGVLACRQGSCTNYTGVTGAWTVVADEIGQEGGFSDFSPPGYAAFYATDNAAGLFRYDESPVDSWATLMSSPEAFTNDGYYSGPAWVDGALYGFAPDQVMKFDIASGTWSAPLTATIDVEEEGQHTHDVSGHVYAIAADGNLLKYDVAAKTMATVTLSVPLTGLSEPRLAWDTATHLLYAAPSFGATELDSIDPKTGAVVLLSPIPDLQISDIFCADRNGHLYANGSEDAAQLYQYDIATDTWKLLSDKPPPFSGQNEGSCTVTSDGWLYFTDGEGSLAKLQLF